MTTKRLNRRPPAPQVSVCGASADRATYFEALRRRLAIATLDRGEASGAEVGRLIERYFGGSAPDHLSTSGLEEIVQRFCFLTEPHCSACPLRYNCAHARRIKKSATENLTLADLFCGSGGLSLGFEQAGFVPVLALDNDYWSAFTYAYNRPDLPDCARIVCEDVADWNERAEVLTTPVDVLAGGVPCQSFSNANRQREVNDPRHNLFVQLFRTVDRVKPRVVLIENVSGFSQVSHSVEEHFRRHGFAARRVILDALDFGLPQRRKRLFFVGFSAAHFSDADARAQAFVGSMLACLREVPPTLREAVGDLPELVAQRISNRPDLESPETGLACQFHDLNSASAYVRAINGPRDRVAVFNHKARYNNDRDIRIFSLLKEGENSLSRSIRDIMPYSSRNHIFKDKYFKLRYDEPCRTITAHMRFDCNMYIHPTQARGLTVREAARVQGFPDDYVFAGTFQSLYRQVGNAVPPPLARNLASALRQLLSAQHD